jgi:lipoprotein-releasing system permease protein
MPNDVSFGAPILTPINHPFSTFFWGNYAALESLTQNALGIPAWISLLLGFLLIVDIYFIFWILMTSRRYPTMVGLRYLKAQQSGGLSVITSIAVMGVALGVAALVTVLSVTSGFQEAFQEKVLGVNAHVLVTKQGIDFREYRDVMKTAEEIDGVTAVAPFLFNEMMVSSGSDRAIVLVKGVDPDRSGAVLDVEKYMVQPKGGDLDLLRPQKEKLPGAILGSELAEKLKVKLGDHIKLTSPLSTLDSTSWNSQGQSPKSQTFEVAGVFNAGFDEYDRRLLYVELSRAQAFFDHGDVVIGVEMKIKNISRAPMVAQELQSRLQNHLYNTIDWHKLNKDLFDALAIQKVVLSLILAIIILVAAINIIGTLHMTVYDKTKEIAILRSMGSSTGDILRIFLTKGIVIGSIGTAIGLVLGYLTCVGLSFYQFPLDPKVYLIHELPVTMYPFEFFVTAQIAMAISFFSTILPSVWATRLRPVEGLRYE